MGREVSGQAVTYTEEIHVNTPERYEIMCITNQVERIIRESGVTDGLVLVNPMHITASVYVNDLEYGLHADIMDWLEKNAAYGVDGKNGPNTDTIAQVRTMVMPTSSDNCWAIK